MKRTKLHILIMVHTYLSNSGHRSESRQRVFSDLINNINIVYKHPRNTPSYVPYIILFLNHFYLRNIDVSCDDSFTHTHSQTFYLKKKE